ncbi:hypothetical protein QBC43DRAFT_300823 [Cladorrhinum sp. PSN259]|nr:hypothetical protein QBC43DRAFT_300823 [Cladorrhinum sp. PSN259]
MDSSSQSTPQLPPGALTDDKSGTVIGVVVFCLLWSTAMVGMRLWVRAGIIKQFGIDDYACIAGLLTTFGSGIAMIHMTTYGFGKHIYVMELANIPLYLRDFYVSIVMYCSALMFLKLSFLFQYYRVLAVQHMRKVYLVAIIIVGGWAISQVLVGIFICSPIQGFWDTTIKSKCIPNIPQWYINAAGNIITDLAVFIMPLPALWKLTLPKAQRYFLVGVFSLGFFTVIISILRIRYLHLYEDFPWENVTAALWSVGELTSAITCACLPTMRPLVRQYLPSLASKLGISAGQSGAGASEPKRSARRPTDPESGIRQPNAWRMQKASMDDVAGSEVDLAHHEHKVNPFEMHVVTHKSSVDGVSQISGR